MTDKRFEDKTPVYENNVIRVDGPNDKDLILKNFQEIPDSFIQSLRDQQAMARPTADMRKVASIPTSIVEHWKRQGFDVHKESAKAIVARLQKEDLGAFVTGLP